jgi:DNA repair protein RadC
MNYSLYESHQKQLSPLRKNWAVAELQVSYKQKNRTGIFISSADMAFRVLRHMWDKSLINIQEQFCVLFLKRNLEVLGFRVINTGTSTSCTVDVNLIISCALLCRANRVILAHNHPSGNLQHSKGDFDLTLSIRNKLQQFEIEVCDHIIITDNDYMSFSDNGIIFPNENQ